MRTLSIWAFMLFAWFMVSCGEQASEKAVKQTPDKYQQYKKQINEAEAAVNNMTDCQKLGDKEREFLDLNTDWLNYRRNADMTDSQIEQLDSLFSQLEALIKGKQAAFDCNKVLDEEDLNASGDYDYPQY